MKIGIIGSRSRASVKDKILVFDTVVAAIHQYGFNDLVLVSGGCPEGADRFAEEAAVYFGISIIIHYPQKLPKVKNYEESVQRFYLRNDKVAADSDIVYAAAAPNRKGGTEYTIKKAQQLGKTVHLI